MFLPNMVGSGQIDLHIASPPLSMPSSSSSNLKEDLAMERRAVSGERVKLLSLGQLLQEVRLHVRPVEQRAKAGGYTVYIYIQYINI